MAITLTIYPATDYNSFVSLAEADAIIETTVHYPQWLAETDDEVKKRLLIAAFRNIVGLEGLTLPSTAETCLKESQSFMAVHDMVNDISQSSGAAGSNTRVSVGPITVEADNGGSPSYDLTPFPATATRCLESYGAKIPYASTFRFDRA